jgi:predicted transcriptional regulator
MIYIHGCIRQPVTALENWAATDSKFEFEEFASILMKIGLKRNVAKVLAYLVAREQTTSREIEIGTDLRQPEVSIAMRELRNLDWIVERDEKNPGKGRPYRIYRLNESLAEIINYLEQEEAKESANTMKKIDKLRTMRA